MGTIGERGAMDLMAFVKLADQLPSLQSIKDDPLNCTRTGQCGGCVYGCLQIIGYDVR